MTGGTPTRRCRSAAPSETTNCNRSDIEYIILDNQWNKSFIASSNRRLVVRVPDRRPDDFLRRGQSGQHLAGAVLAQRAHAHLTGAGAQDRCRNLLVNQFARLVVDDKNLEDPEASAVTART